MCFGNIAILVFKAATVGYLLGVLIYTTLPEADTGGSGGWWPWYLPIHSLLIFVTRLSRARYPTTVTDFMSLTGVESRMSCLQYEYRNHYLMKADCILL